MADASAVTKNPQTLAITGGACGLCILYKKNAPWT